MVDPAEAAEERAVLEHQEALFVVTAARGFHGITESPTRAVVEELVDQTMEVLGGTEVAAAAGTDKHLITPEMSKAERRTVAAAVVQDHPLHWALAALVS